MHTNTAKYNIKFLPLKYLPITTLEQFPLYELVDYSFTCYAPKYVLHHSTIQHIYIYIFRAFVFQQRSTPITSLCLQYVNDALRHRASPCSINSCVHYFRYIPYININIYSWYMCILHNSPHNKAKKYHEDTLDTFDLRLRASLYSADALARNTS